MVFFLKKNMNIVAVLLLVVIGLYYTALLCNSKNVIRDRKSKSSKISSQIVPLEERNNIGHGSLLDIKQHNVSPVEEYILLSRNKPVREKSNRSPHKPEYAVDGAFVKTATSVPGCSHTRTGDDYPWLLIDLQHDAVIKRVDLYNRLDCCSERLKNFRIHVSNTDDVNQFLNAPTCEPEFEGNLKNVEVHHVNCNLKGRYVIIYINSTNAILTLCEVEVFGKFVDQCQENTHNCDQNSTCKYNPNGGFTCSEGNNGLKARLEINT